MKNKKMNKTNSFITRMLLFFGFLLAVVNLYGQSSASTKSEAADYCPNEISIWGAGGFNSLSYSPEFGERSSKLGGAFGLGYTYYFDRHFGILLGAELAFYGSDFKLNNLSGSYLTVDADDEAINYNTTVKGYEERQRMMNVNIPLMLQYQTAGKHKFYAGLGFKLGIPVSGKYKIADGATLTASGYYHETMQELFDQRDLGYGTFDGSSQKGDIDFKLAYMGAAEAGMKWSLSPVLSLYTGLYFEYGFNDIAKKHNDPFVAYNNIDPENPQFNSALTSQYGESNKSVTDRVFPMAFGLKLRLGIDLCKGKEKPAKVEPVKPVPAPAPVPVPEVKKEVPPPPPPAPVVEPESRRARARALVASRGDEEEKPIVLPEVKASVKKIFERALQGIQFEANKAVIKSESFPILNEIVQAMNENPSYNLIISGHTDTSGKPETNWVLSKDRANAVKFYLIGKGISESRLTAEGFGDTKPLVPNDTAENRAKNRRVEFVVKFEQEVPADN